MRTRTYQLGGDVDGGYASIRSLINNGWKLSIAGRPVAVTGVLGDFPLGMVKFDDQAVLLPDNALWRAVIAYFPLIATSGNHEVKVEYKVSSDDDWTFRGHVYKETLLSTSQVAGVIERLVEKL